MAAGGGTRNGRIAHRSGKGPRGPGVFAGPCHCGGVFPAIHRVDQGLFLFYGDFNVQQIPFYQMCHDAVRSGNIFWSWTTDLGANFIGSYSFYLLGSPFFWATIPFPSEAVPYLMGPLLILKFACASLTGYVYLRRYAANADYAVLGGLLYAFSGFSVYNIFFNHFHEAIVFFPLLLFALDEFVMERRRGLFCLMVAACCFVNYYFFVGQVVFCLLYFLVRVCSGNWRIRLRDFGLLALESALGVLLTSGLLLPTVLAVLQNPRVDKPAGRLGVRCSTAGTSGMCTSSSASFSRRISRTAKFHAGFRVQMGVARRMAAALRHDGRHRLFADPPQELAEKTALPACALRVYPGAQFGVPAL